MLVSKVHLSSLHSTCTTITFLKAVLILAPFLLLFGEVCFLLIWCWIYLDFQATSDLSCIYDFLENLFYHVVLILSCFISQSDALNNVTNELKAD